MRRVRRVAVASLARLCAAIAGVGATAGVALAHGGSLSAAAGDSLSVPTWLVVATGGVAVGASVLLVGFGTDRALVRAVHDARRRVGVPAERALRAALQVAGVVVLVGVLGVGVFGPANPLSNAAVTVVWVGWWAGFVMTTYLVGNAWPLVDPWRTVARALPSVGRTYEWRYGAWPSVAGLVALVWLEVVSPVADRPRVLAVVVLAYSVVTVAGATVYGTATWFGTVDPVARVLRYYGHVAPLTTDGAGPGRLSLRLPGVALSDDLLDGLDEVTFVVALLWATTYDGFVTTPLWESLARWAVSLGVPATLVYPFALVAGLCLFVGLYLLAVRLARRTGETDVAPERLARRFAPPLLAIAAGSHLAHFLGYFLALAPVLAATLTAPFGTVSAPVLVLPEWFGVVALAAVLVGHMLAVWAAHAAALDVFPDRVRAVRTHYPFVAVMVLYTTASLWVVSRPDVTPPFV